MGNLNRISALKVNLSEDRRKLFDKYVDMIFNEETHQANSRICRMLEKELKEIHGVRYCVVCGSGTFAIEIIAKYLKSKYNLEYAITQSATFIATAMALNRAGYKVLVSDVSDDVVFMDGEDVVNVIKEYALETDIERVLIVPVPMFGFYNEGAVNEIVDIVKDKTDVEPIVFLDGAHIFGIKSKYDFALSLMATKVIGGGEGGAILTNDKELYEFARHAVEFGKVGRRFHMWGYNYKMSEFDAAMILSGVKFAHKEIQKRKNVHEMYVEGLNDEEGIKMYNPDECEYNGYVSPIYVDVCSRTEFEFRMLDDYGIECWHGMYRCPINEEPVWRIIGFGYRETPNARRFAEHMTYLPNHTKLTNEDVEYVIECVKALVRRIRGDVFADYQIFEKWR